MTGTGRIFFDTSPFVYLVENHWEYYPMVASFISSEMVSSEFGLATSVITLAEFEVKPKRNNQLQVIEKFRSKLKELDFANSTLHS